MCVCVTYIILERLGIEGAREHEETRKQGASYECPHPVCDGTMYDRLADHLSVRHNLRGGVWKPLRQRLLSISKAGGPEHVEEAEMLKRLPVKVKDFEGDTISLDYLSDAIDEEGWEADAITAELMMPCPLWAQTEAVMASLEWLTHTMAERIFKNFPRPNVFVDNVMDTITVDRRKAKRKRL